MKRRNSKNSNQLTVIEKSMLLQRSKQLPKLTHSQLVSWSLKQFNKKINRTTITKWISSGKFDHVDPLIIDKPNTIRSRPVKFPALDERLSMWCFKYEKIAIISDAIIKEQARIFAKEMNISIESFKFSDGWLSSFKRRHGIKKRTISGESASVDIKALEAALPSLLDKIKKFKFDDVFNFDETALFYRLCPDKTLASSSVEGKKV